MLGMHNTSPNTIVVVKKENKQVNKLNFGLLTH